MNIDIDVTKLVELYGPFKVINRERERELIKEGKEAHILTVCGQDVDYENLSEENRPSDEELKDRGETKEEYSTTILYASVGRRWVNMQEIYESTKPMPVELELEDKNIWFGDDGLPEGR